ncbi:ras GTPase-activating protein [Macrolepiota fuliginosa MF-IS2]|uniref:Ras GTPase-activating protein n=1 Tax=Macrolepiota fuliginosa MF-IS2 TaxID=1400762 RepID=A0A9P5XJU9_9AGAR|nr:ras GTPase-activating protein [Macrolepiota fuliginosa MF-IS2]
MSTSNSTPTHTPKSSSGGPFAYQTRLLERTSSSGGGSRSLSRNNSQSGIGILTTPTGPSNPSLGSRRWTPSHRPSSSLDVLRGKWEERSREADVEDTRHSNASPTRETFRSRSQSALLENISPDTTNSSTSSHNGPPSATPLSSVSIPEMQKTPTYLKRRTMPEPIIASPLSPNTTGISVEADSPSSSSPHRIHIPSSTTPFTSSSSRHSSSHSFSSSPNVFVPPSTRSYELPKTSTVRQHSPLRSHSSLSSHSPSNSQASYSRDENKPEHRPPVAHPNDVFSPPTATPTATLSRNRSRSLYGSSAILSTPEKSAQQPFYTLSRNKSVTSLADDKDNSKPFYPVGRDKSVASLTEDKPASPQPSSLGHATSSAMSPTPYRSSYMSSKKGPTYGDNLIVGRRMGRHLPRIASGDGDENWEEETKPTPIEEQKPILEELEQASPRRERRRAGLYGKVPTSPPRGQPIPEIPGFAVPESEGVAGLPGRLQLKAPSAPTSPAQSSRYYGSNWADTQRHFIQAYEYLCHVGEAHQWIEGCVREEIGFNIVEMEDGLRNGVTLAKLVRVFHPHAVRRIFESSNLRDFRHSDNINIFFQFVRDVGLPEGFIFELTDLYEKKNIPKVIYCIHALSHLLARRGMAQRIGNLIGHLHFSDDELQKTQKGLKELGGKMPNFGDVGRELAKEINEEPEPEIETEAERCHRLLLENEDSIVAVQALARGYLARRARANIQARMRFAERHITKFQTQCRGFLLRNQVRSQRREQRSLVPWVIALQSTARAAIAKRRWKAYMRRIRATSSTVIKVQAQSRGVLQRRRFQKLKGALRTISTSMTRLQAFARARITRTARTEIKKTFSKPQIGFSVVRFQAFARGALVRRALERQQYRLTKMSPVFAGLQAQLRGILVRRRVRSQLAKLENVTDVVIRIQAAVRTYLARKRLLALIRGLRRVTPLMVDFQARARAKIARQQHTSLVKALEAPKNLKMVSLLQALARASLVRHRHVELKRSLDYAVPDVTNLQAAIRGAFVRNEYHAWRDHLHRSKPVATVLQAMLRGVLVRRQFKAKMDYYRANLSKVVKIQSLFRAKETREQYRQLTMGTNVTVGTIKNFVHLLDDSEADFQEEIKVERLRKQVVECIRENQALENEVNDLDVKVALVVDNAKKRKGADNATMHAARVKLLADYGDPFSGSSAVDHTARRKLELYQQLFFFLQTRGEYLSRLLLKLSQEGVAEPSRRFMERAVLTLFGYGQDRREDFLLLKLLQLAIRDEITSATSIDDLMRNHAIYLNITVHYIRPKQSTFAREAFQTIIKEVIDSTDLDLEADPTLLHHSRITMEELKSGMTSPTPKDVTFREALEYPETRAMYIRQLQLVQWWTDAFVNAITASIKKMPFSMRYLARETLLALRERFPKGTDEQYAACIGRLVYYRYLYPIIMTPEVFEIVPKTVKVTARKNLAQISKVLTQIVTGRDFGDDQPIYIPVNDFVREASGRMTAWLLEVADVPDAESHFYAHEFLDVTVQPKPIYISPNEVYTMHGLLLQHLKFLAPQPNDMLRVILNELVGVPNLTNDELKDARDTAITLELTNRFATVGDPHAEEKTLWVQAKRGVLAILRVQPAQDLLESLMRPVTDQDESGWEDILEAEALNERSRQHSRRQPSAIGNDAYRLEDIRTWRFAAVKALAITNLLELEKQGKITRDDGFQGILNAIAGDVRSKHRKRMQRQQEMKSMREALRHLQERKKYYEEQISSYQNHVQAAMNTMQQKKGKKRFILPFTKQYWHVRELQKAGVSPKFGSYFYTAKDLYDKKILLSIEQYSPRQYDKFHIKISSDSVGIFTLILESTMLGITSKIATENIRMEDLLQAKYEKQMCLALFDGRVKVNFEPFLDEINKNFLGS